MYKKIVLPILTILIMPNITFANDLGSAIKNATKACSGIDDSLLELKKKAGINTAVTAVGTASGAVALGTGIAKIGVDKDQHALEEKVKKLIVEKAKVEVQKLDLDDEIEFRAAVHRLVYDVASKDSTISTDLKKIEELDKKSKTLGNVRTGTLAVSTATNIVGTAISATNKVDEDLEEKINKCVYAIKDLSSAKLAAKVENTATDIELAKAEKIIISCRDYEYIDIKPINKRATGAAVASGIGIGTGVVGTITSAVANTNKTRQGDEQKEKNLNATANVMSGASTVASATATIFNATQISAIKKVATVAEVCEGALK